jgi:hypothetical protein
VTCRADVDCSASYPCKFPTGVKLVDEVSFSAENADAVIAALLKIKIISASKQYTFFMPSSSFYDFYIRLSM